MVMLHAPIKVLVASLALVGCAASGQPTDDPASGGQGGTATSSSSGGVAAGGSSSSSASSSSGGASSSGDSGASGGTSSSSGGSSSSGSSGTGTPPKVGLTIEAGTVAFYDGTAGARRNQAAGGGGSGMDGVTYILPTQYMIDNVILLNLSLRTVPGNYVPVGDYPCTNVHDSSQAIPSAYLSYYKSSGASYKTGAGTCTVHVTTSSASGAAGAWRIVGTITGDLVDTFSGTNVAITDAGFDLTYSN